jgi:hypothetical protein
MSLFATTSSALKYMGATATMVSIWNVEPVHGLKLQHLMFGTGAVEQLGRHDNRRSSAHMGPSVQRRGREKPVALGNWGQLSDSIGVAHSLKTGGGKRVASAVRPASAGGRGPASAFPQPH